MITCALSEVASSSFLTLTQEQDLEGGASGPGREAHTGCTLSPSKKRHFLGRSPPFSLQFSLQTHTTHERKQSQVPRCLPGSGGPCTAAATRPHFDSPCHAHATAAAAGVAEAVPLPRCPPPQPGRQPFGPHWLVAGCPGCGQHSNLASASASLARVDRCKTL